MQFTQPSDLSRLRCLVGNGKLLETVQLVSSKRVMGGKRVITCVHSLRPPNLFQCVRCAVKVSVMGSAGSLSLGLFFLFFWAAADHFLFVDMFLTAGQCTRCCPHIQKFGVYIP